LEGPVSSSGVPLRDCQLRLDVLRTDVAAALRQIVRKRLQPPGAIEGDHMPGQRDVAILLTPSALREAFEDGGERARRLVQKSIRI